MDGAAGRLGRVIEHHGDPAKEKGLIRDVPCASPKGQIQIRLSGGDGVADLIAGPAGHAG